MNIQQEMLQELPRPGKNRFPAEFQGYSKKRRAHSGRVPPAAAFARLLKQAEPAFGPLTTGEIRPPSASADGQTGEPGSSLPGVNPRRSR